MTVKYPALQAVLDQHTVDTGGRRLVAGFLVRCQTTRKDLGYVWLDVGHWGWRTPDGTHFGERATQRAAVEVLREAYDLAHDPQRPLPFSGDPTVAEILDAWRAPLILPTPYIRDRWAGQASGQASGGRPQGQASGQASGGRPQGQASGGRPQGRPQGQASGQASGGRPQGRPQGQASGGRPQGQASGQASGQAPAEPPKKIVWTTQTPDITAALAAAFRRRTSDK